MGDSGTLTINQKTLTRIAMQRAVVMTQERHMIIKEFRGDLNLIKGR
mgnify:CR=1 FL=1